MTRSAWHDRPTSGNDRPPPPAADLSRRAFSVLLCISRKASQAPPTGWASAQIGCQIGQGEYTHSNTSSSREGRRRHYSLNRRNAQRLSFGVFRESPLASTISRWTRSVASSYRNEKAFAAGADIMEMQPKRHRYVQQDL
jgi:hypothetical protein